MFRKFHSWITMQETYVELSSVVKRCKEQNLYKEMVEFRISILFQYSTYIFAKFNTFPRPWKRISQFSTFLILSMRRGNPPFKRFFFFQINTRCSLSMHHKPVPCCKHVLYFPLCSPIFYFILLPFAIVHRARCQLPPRPSRLALLLIPHTFTPQPPTEVYTCWFSLLIVGVVPVLPLALMKVVSCVRTPKRRHQVLISVFCWTPA